MTINKHVIVETNFLVDLLRPFKSVEAENLLNQHGGNLYLYIPWCCQSEAVRTLERIPREDLGFGDSMLKLAQRLYLPSDPLKMIPFQELKTEADKKRTSDLNTIPQRIATVCQQICTIKPSPDVIAKTLSIFKTKLLAPFDEMVLGAVLAQTEDLKKIDPTCKVYFASLNSKDFGTEILLSEYKKVDLEYNKTFSIP